MLSIVIVTCNRQVEVQKTIKSILVQNVANWVEFIIIDNASTDDTKSVIIKTIENAGIPYEYIRLSENMGVAKARNIGYSKTRGDVAFFIDDDAYIISGLGTLRKAYDFILSDEKIGALALEIFDTKKNVFLLNSIDAKGELDTLGYIGAAHFVRKFKVNKLYPDVFFYGAEELYGSLTIWNMGKCIKYYQELKICHDPSMHTRMQPKENKKNILINTYCVKKIFISNAVDGYLKDILYMTRIVKHFGFFRIIEFVRRAEMNIANCEPVKFKKDIRKKLIKKFGLLSIL